MSDPFLVDMEPVGRRAEAGAGDSLLEVAQNAGVELAAICGGIGACDTCRVRLVKGKLSPLTLVEEGEFSPEALRAGWRLACQASPLSDVKIEIPPESLTTPQRLQIEGETQTIAVDPVVTVLDVNVPPPTATDLRADATRLEAAICQTGVSETMPVAPLSINIPMLARLSQQLREQDWSARLAIRNRRTVVGILPAQRAPLGLAVDIGTTSIAAYLVDLATGHILAKTGAMNPQIAYGEDVISRIVYINQHPEDPAVLQRRVVTTLNEIAQRLCAEVGAVSQEIVEAVLVGNTAMHHIVAGLPVKQLGEAPYVPAVSDALEFPALSIGLSLSPGAIVYMPPNIAGYVGADHVAVLLATGLWNTTRTLLAIDIGTNTEVTLATNGQRFSCSCASGPAFEGAHIRDGMRAAAGAVERVQIIDGRIRTKTIGGSAPIGICGSGILDAVAAMVDVGLIGSGGNLQAGYSPANQGENGRTTFVLVPAELTGHGRSITISRKDVSEIQLAKSAIRTGIELLLEQAEIGAGEIEEFIIAGAFGTYIDIGSALRIGMFPPIPAGRIRQVGNAAGMGAWQLLISNERRQQAEMAVKDIHYVELTTYPGFQDTFVNYLTF